MSSEQDIQNILDTLEIIEKLIHDVLSRLGRLEKQVGIDQYGWPVSDSNPGNLDQY